MFNIQIPTVKPSLKKRTIDSLIRKYSGDLNYRLVRYSSHRVLVWLPNGPLFRPWFQYQTKSVGYSNGDLNTGQFCLLFISSFYLEPGIWIQWGSEIWPLEIQKNLKSGLFKSQISSCPNSNILAVVMVIALVPTSRKWDQSKSGHFVWISNDLGQIAPICPDFKWLGFQISDPVQNPNLLQPNLFSPFEIQTSLNQEKVKLA